jgi:hypothetical protein
MPTMQIISWVLGVPAAVLAIAYAIILAEVMAAKRRINRS